MSTFAQALLRRHARTDNHVGPRLRSWFEPAGSEPPRAADPDGLTPPVANGEETGTKAMSYPFAPAGPPPHAPEAAPERRAAIQPANPARPRPATSATSPISFVREASVNSAPPVSSQGQSGQGQVSSSTTEQPATGWHAPPSLLPQGTTPPLPFAPVPGASTPPPEADWLGPPPAPGGVLSDYRDVPAGQPASRHPGAAQAPPAPVIKVTIGRIDVRAIMPPAPAKIPAPMGPRPVLSLEDYLSQRPARARF